MSFYGLVLLVTLLILSVYVGAILGEMSAASRIADAYYVIAAGFARSPCASAPAA